MDRIAIIIRFIVITVLALIASALLLLFIVNRSEKNKYTHKKIVQVTKNDPNRSESQSKLKGLIPSNRVPKDYDEAKDAATIELVPGRWQDDPKKPQQTGGEKADLVKIPTEERLKIADMLDKFLRKWETFTPGSEQNFKDYKDLLTNFVLPTYLDSVANREDNHQPLRICPQATCRVGSRWDDGTSYASMTVRTYDGDTAWITTVGPVRLRSYEENDPVNGIRFLRSYSLLIEKENGEWKIRRAAADTIDKLPTYIN